MKEFSNSTASLLKTTVEKEPSGMMWDFSLNEINEFVENYLERRGVDKVSRVVTQIIRDGHANPELAITVFIDPNSSMITKSNTNILPAIREKMEVPTVVSSDLKHILEPVALRRNDYNDKRGGNIELSKFKGAYYVKLDPLKVFAMMLGVIPRETVVYVLTAYRFGKNNGAVKLSKNYVEYNTSTNNTNNKFEALAAEINRR